MLKLGLKDEALGVGPNREVVFGVGANRKYWELGRIEKYWESERIGKHWELESMQESL